MHSVSQSYSLTQYVPHMYKNMSQKPRDFIHAPTHTPTLHMTLKKLNSVTNTGEVVHTYTTVDIQRHVNSSHRVTNVLTTLESQY